MDDVRAEPGEAVDHLVDGVLVPGDQRAGEDDGVALLDVHEVVVALGDPAQRRHRLALAAGGDQHLTLGGEVGEVLGVDHHAGRDVEVAEVLGDAHVADHRAPDVPDLAAVPDRRVEDLLDAVHVGGEAGDDDPLVAARGRRVSRTGAMYFSEVVKPGTSALVESVRKRSTPSSPSRANARRSVIRPSSGSWSILKSPVCRTSAGAGADRDGQRVGDRVVDGDELELERTEGEPVARLDLVVDRLLEPVLAELGVEEGEGQLGADERDVAALAQEVRRGADVVLVAVGQHQRLDLVEAVSDRVEVGQDQVDARMVLLGEEDAAVDDQQAPVVLEDGHVATDLAEPAERVDP